MTSYDAAYLQTYRLLNDINVRPEPFEFYTAKELWTDEYTSMKMLEYHLNESVDLSSRNKDFIETSAQWIVSHFDITSGTSIADFGCGPGLYTTLFAENGAEVTGIDFSKRSIEYAKSIASKKRLHIDYIQQNYLGYETRKKFDFITMIFCDFCALSPAQRKTLLSKFYEMVKVGGAVLLDAYSLNFFEEKKESATYELNQLNHFWAPENYYGFLNTFKYYNEKLILEKYTIVDERRTRVFYNWLQCFSLSSLQREFEEAGFITEEFYSDVTGSSFSSDSSNLAIVARKFE